jgi:hypothetical protein
LNRQCHAYLFAPAAIDNGQVHYLASVGLFDRSFKLGDITSALSIHAMIVSCGSPILLSAITASIAGGKKTAPATIPMNRTVVRKAPGLLLCKPAAPAGLPGITVRIFTPPTTYHAAVFQPDRLALHRDA